MRAARRAVLAASLLARPALALDAPMEVAPGLFVLPGEDGLASAANDNAIANTAFLVGTDSVAVVDAGGSLAHGTRLRRSVRAVTGLPIRHLILTHVHPDHVLGAAAFASLSPQVIGHVRLPEALAQRHEGYLRALLRDVGPSAAGSGALAPTRLVTEAVTLELGGRQVEIRAHPSAHTDTDLTVLDHGTGTLLGGDLVFLRHIPTLDGSLKGWITELEALKSLRVARLVPGHGPPAAPWPAAAEDTLRYLRALREGTRAAIAAGTGIAEAPTRVAMEEAARWRLAEAHHGRNVTAAYRELEWE